MEMNTKSSMRKSNSKRLGKMSKASMGRATRAISDILAEYLSDAGTVQVVTLDITSLNVDGVLVLLNELAPEANAFGIHELAAHYGEASDEDFFPMLKEHIRLIVWSARRDAVVNFCHLYAALVGDRGDRLFKPSACNQLSVDQAVNWLSEYAGSPISNYEGECDPEFRHAPRPASARHGIDDLYKVPCYRWREKRKNLDWRLAKRPFDDFILVSGEGEHVKRALVTHPQWQ